MKRHDGLRIDVRDQPDRNLVVLLLDMSASMLLTERGQPIAKIDQLEAALADFLGNGMHVDPENPSAVNRLDVNGEIAVGAFNETLGGTPHVEWLPLAEQPVEEGSPFYYVQDVTGLTPHAKRALRPAGRTPIGEAIEIALDAIEARKNQLMEDGLTHEFRPNLYLMTDGESTRPVEAAAARLQTEESENRVLFWIFGTIDAKQEDLFRLTKANDNKNCLLLGALPLGKVLKFVNTSMRHQAGLATDLPATKIYTTISRDFVDDTTRPLL